MKFSGLTIAAMVLLGTHSFAQDQSLGDVARETRTRIQNTKPTKTLSNEDSDAQAITFSDDPLKVISKAAEAMVRDNSHRCHQVSSGNFGPGWTRDVTTEFAAGDRMRSVGNQEDQWVETIIIGQDGYRRTGSAPWVRVNPGEMAWYHTWTNPATFKLPDELKFGYKTGDMKLIGSELIQGLSTLHYEFKLRDSLIDRTVDVWVGIGDTLPRKTEMMTYDLQMKTSWHTTTECTYGVEIKIEPPM